MSSLTIWTVGHSTRTIGEFLDILQANQIEILVDVRHFPGSRRFPHFNKGALVSSDEENEKRHVELMAK